MKPEVSGPMKIERDELHEALAHATKAGRATGAAAKAVAQALHAHFAREEEFALPPLGLLPALATMMCNLAWPTSLS